jgi:hypothetical protein
VELSENPTSEGIGLPSDCVETVWTSCWNGKYRESVDLESEDIKFKLRVLQEKVVSHTDATARVYRLDDHEPDN